ncbi:hypothetical protein [Cupriavidus metallidurans]|uniref:hypothetical protein n=1 Tax=Cupriavidus metallidurans TaxID=119219 RepID=UPI001CCD6128|nr:hypothetical protein [Cupriavidus metallidurans]UBM08794.1 hypothetical protein LAI70_02535 [Cupriavidus metallidurans]
MSSLLDSSLHAQTVLAIPSEFFPIHRPDPTPHDEWMAVLPDNTEIVVADMAGKPAPRGIEKAIATAQSRAYSEALARQLLVPLSAREILSRLRQSILVANRPGTTGFSRLTPPGGAHTFAGQIQIRDHL